MDLFFCKIILDSLTGFAGGLVLEQPAPLPAPTLTEAPDAQKGIDDAEMIDAKMESIPQVSHVASVEVLNIDLVPNKPLKPTTLTPEVATQRAVKLPTILK